MLSSCDVEQIRTDTLVVWIRRPDTHHQNWWIGYYSSDVDEARFWHYAMIDEAQSLGLQPFHQGCWDIDHRQQHPGCKEWLDFTTCPGVAQAFEMWIGCGKYAIPHPDASLDDLVSLGDTALARVIAAIPVIQAAATRRYQAYYG